MADSLLRDKVLILTGASEGIGRALALKLSRRGVRLALVARSEGRLKEVAHETGGTAIPADLSKESEIDRVIAETRRVYGRVDGIINNAGRGIYGELEQTEFSAIESVFRLNVWAPVHFMRKLAPILKQNRFGIVVNISSIAGIIVVPRMSVYSASKFALYAFSEGFRFDVAPYGISVLSVMPGLIETNFGDHADTYGYRPDVRGMGKTTAEQCAQSIVRAIETGKKRLLVGADARAAALIVRLSRTLIDWILSRNLPKSRV